MPRRADGEGDSADRVSGSRGEIYIEYKQVGQTMKVTAVDAATGAEVVIMGPASASQADLQKVAVRKLEMQLRKAREGEGHEDVPDDDDMPGPKGWIV